MEMDLWTRAGEETTFVVNKSIIRRCLGRDLGIWKYTSPGQVRKLQ